MSSTENNNLNAAVEAGIDYDTLAHIDTITDAAGRSMGPVLNDGYTDDLQPTLSGRLPMGDGQVLRVYCNGVVLGYCDIGENGNWSFKPDAPLEPGRTYDFQVFLLDSGSTELLPSNTYTIHTTELNQDAAPVAPVITEVFDHAGDHQGPVAQGGKTDDKQPEVSGTADAGSVVTVKVYSAVKNHTYTLGSVVADADGHWSYKLHGTQNITATLGEWTFTATATNALGTSDSSAGYSVETVASNTDVFATPEITAIIDAVGLHQGIVANGGKTDDHHPGLRGTGEPGSIVTIKMYGPVSHKTSTDAHVTVGNDGTWSYQFTNKQGLQSGDNVFTVTTTDTDGHVLTGESYTVTLTGSNADDNTPPDITPPDAPNIYAAQETNDDGTQHGVGSGGTTEDSTPELLGAAEPDSIVTVYDGAVVIGSVAADSEGNWIYDVSQALADGKHTFTVTATDAAGNTSDHSPSYTLDVETADITPPDAPVIENYHDDVGDYKGDFKSGTTTDDASPELKGHAEANSIVKVYEGSTLLGSTTAHDDGSWSFTPSARTDGSHTFTATATDAAGNVSDTSGSFVITIDTHTEMTITGLQDDAGTVTGLVADGGLTDDSSPVLIGTAEPGSIVYISSTGVYGESYSFTVTVGDDGKWTLPQSFAKGNYGTFSYNAYSVDAAGNHSEAVTFSVEFVASNQDDITPPDAPVITGAIETYDDGTNIGVANDATIDDNTPRLYGDAEAGSIVTIYDGAVVIGSVAADSKGAWTYDVSQTLADGKHTFTITATDAAGNSSIHSGNFVLDVETADTTPPDAPVITGAIETYDDGTNVGVSNDATIDDNTPRLYGDAEAGSIVTIYDGAVVIGSVAADSKGAWTYDVSRALADGKHTFTITATDAAGNSSIHSGNFVLDVETADTTPPDAPVITEVYDDQGLTQGPVANGGKTDDTLLKISGTAEHDSIVVISHVIEATGHTYIDGSVVTDASGHWTFQMTGDGFDTTAHGNRIITATATDAAGNTSEPSDSYVVNFVDTNYDGTTPPGVSGIESFNQADMPHLITDSFTTESGLVLKSLGGEIDLQFWPEQENLRDETGGYNFLNTIDCAGVNITLPGSADSVTFVGAIDVSDSSSVQAYDWAGHLITVSVTHIGPNSNGGLDKYLLTPAAGQHIASFNVVGSPFIDTIQWTSAGTAHAAQQSALLTSPDAVEHHDIMTLAQVDDSHKSTAAVDITDHVQNTLHLTLNDILSEAHPNLFVQDGKQQLAVTGDQGDVVELKVDDLTHNTWQDSGAVTAGGVQYEVYQHAGSDVELLVQHGLELHQVS